MIRRLIGLLIILRAFTPLLVILAIVLYAAALGRDLSAAAEIPLRSIQADMQAFASDLNTFGERVGSTVQAFNNLLGRLSFSLPRVNIGPVRFSLPLIGEINFGFIINPVTNAINWLVDRINDVLRLISNFLGDLLRPLKTLFEPLESASQRLEPLRRNLERLGENVGGVLGHYGALLPVGLGILAVLALLYVSVPFVDQVWRGWRMLRGLSA